MKSAVITQPNYIPWKGYFDQIRTADEFVVYDDVQYMKRGWQNRNRIKTPQGTHWLSIPVEVKGKFNQKIKDTRIADKSWTDKHWKSLQSSYAKAPYFSEYAERLETAYADAKSLDFLSEVNVHFIKACCEWLGLKPSISFSGDYELLEDRTERLAHICSQLSCDRYLSGPAAKAYMEHDFFADRKIAVQYFKYDAYPEYEQVHGAFVHEVTILDLLFHTGERALEYLQDDCLEPEPFVSPKAAGAASVTSVGE